jgi:hypothetical protein
MGKYSKKLIAILILSVIFYIGFFIYQKVSSKSKYEYFKGEIRKIPNYMKANPENAPNYYKGSLKKAPNYKKAKMKDNPNYIKAKNASGSSKKKNRREELLQGLKENW